MTRTNSVLVMGTDTGVGKTVVTALLTRAFQDRGVDAIPFKPVASGSIVVADRRVWPDIAFLAAAGKTGEETVGLYRFDKPLSPHLAAADEGKLIDIGKIGQGFEELAGRHEAVIVEGVGGAMTPLNDRETFLDLARLLGLPAIIVARPGLGTLNHTLLTVEACRDRGIDVAGLVINRYPANPCEAESRNPSELERLTGVPVLGVLPEIDLSVEQLETGRLFTFTRRLDLTRLKTDRPDYIRAKRADESFVWHPFSPMLEYLGEKPHPLMIVRADGSRLEDSEGKKYIDGVSSLWVNVHGHRRRELDLAIKEQLGKVAHTTLLGLASEPSALLAEELVKMTPDGLNRVFYSDNGSTAVEIAIKVAFQYQKQTGRPEKEEFVSFVNAYHGDTLGAVSVGGHELFHSKFEPLLFRAHLMPAAYCYRCPASKAYPECDFNCLETLAETLAARAGKIAAVIAEPKVQGAAGVLVQPPGYLARIAGLCRRHDVLLIVDEVATGFGRTGALFASDLEGIKPDIMAVAKGITGGYLPLAATLFREEIYRAFLGRYEEYKTFFHGHTYTGNPLACAAARANLELISQPDFLPGINNKADYLSDLLLPVSRLRHVGDVRQCGLMVGIELVADKPSKKPFGVEKRIGRQVILKARTRGVIIRPLGDVIVLMPPLTIDPVDLQKLVEVTTWAIEEVTVD